MAWGRRGRGQSPHRRALGDPSITEAGRQTTRAAETVGGKLGRLEGSGWLEDWRDHLHWCAVLELECRHLNSKRSPRCTHLLKSRRCLGSFPSEGSVVDLSPCSDYSNHELTPHSDLVHAAHAPALG